MQKTAIARYVRISEKKLCMATRDLQGMMVGKALPMLLFARNNAARTVGGVVKTGMSLYPSSVDKQALRIQSVMIDQGPRLKRWRPGGRGVAKKYERKTAHISITLSDNGK